MVKYHLEICSHTFIPNGKVTTGLADYQLEITTDK